MINKIELKNFQAHKHSVLELDPNINVITGKSDSGKTSIIRALYYAVYNKPASNNYPANFIKNEKGNLTDTCQVAITKKDKSIVRFRTNTENGYIVNNETLSAIGRDVPEDVISFFNLSDVNIQRQLDSHFLLSETSGEIAKFFNKLVNLDIIQDYLSNIESMRRKCKKEAEAVKTNICEITEQLTKYNWIEKAEILNEKYETYNSKIDIEITNKNELWRSIKSYEGYIYQLEQLSDVTEITNIINNLKEIMQDINKLQEKKHEVDRLIFNYLDTKNELHNIGDFETLTTIIEKFQNIIEKETMLQDEHTTILNSINLYKQLKNDFHSINIELLEKQLPDICPLCGNQFQGEIK